jgi:hypothetical protein
MNASKNDLSKSGLEAEVKKEKNVSENSTAYRTCHVRHRRILHATGYA